MIVTECDSKELLISRDGNGVMIRDNYWRGCRHSSVVYIGAFSLLFGDFVVLNRFQMAKVQRWSGQGE